MNMEKSDMSEKKRSEELSPVYSRQIGDVENLRRQGSVHDDVFGEIKEGGPNYRDVGWAGTAALMMKTQVGLGVLSIPTVFHELGLIPGVIVLLTIAVITTWSNWIIGQFKRNHPKVYGIDDVGMILFGPVGYWVLGACFVLFWVFTAAAGMLSLSIGLNALSTHGACTIVFVTVAAICGFLFGSLRTLAKISWLAWLGLAGILLSVFTLTVAVGVQDRPATAPQDGPWSSDYQLTSSPNFAKASAAISSLVYAYAGTPGFFSIHAEMRDHRKYTRSLMICQCGMTTVYLVVGIVVYYFCGSYVASPALGSAGVLMKKVCYGLAMPGLLATTVITTHFAAKYFFVRILKGSKHLVSNSWQHWTTWISCTASVTIISYIIASSIPNFNSLVSLIGALLGAILSFQPYACMWFKDNYTKGKTEKTLKWKLQAAWAVFVIIAGTFLMIAGTYGSLVGVIDSFNADGNAGVFSCADNSGSV